MGKETDVLIGLDGRPVKSLTPDQLNVLKSGDTYSIVPYFDCEAVVPSKQRIEDGHYPSNVRNPNIIIEVDVFNKVIDPYEPDL